MSGVTVICPNNRRVTVKFDGAAKSLYQILDEACKKQGFVTEKYGLKHHNRFIDLSVTFRMSGLPQNCTLDMAELDYAEQQRQGKRESEDVQVALQLPDGNRLVGNIPSDATLLDALLTFEKQCETKLVEPDGEGENVQPICYYLNNEFIGSKALGSTKLKDLGIRGRALFRYAARQVEPSKIQEINDAIDRVRAKQLKMEATFEKKLQDNLEHERDLERRRQEEEALEQLRQQQIELQSIASTTDDVAMESSTPVAPSSPSTVPKYASRDEQGTTSSASGVTDRQARLDALQSMLSMVDRAIVDNSELPWNLDPNSRQPPAQMVAAPEPVSFQNFKFPKETEGVDLRSRDQSASAGNTPRIEPCDRRSVAYSLADVAGAEVVDEFPAEVYDVTVDDVRSMLSDIQGQSDERALLPESYVRQKDFERKIQAWKMTVIRVRMPDRTVLQGVFRSLETVAALYQFVEGSLRDRNSNFRLCLPPNIGVDNSDRSLLQAGLAPRATLLFRSKSVEDTPREESYLASELIIRLKSPAEVDRMAAESLAENTPYVAFRGTVDTTGQRSQASGASASGGKSDAAPKWLQGKGKK